MNHETPTEDELHAYVDGQLPPARRAAVEAWLAANPARADEVRAWKRDADRLRALMAQPDAWDVVSFERGSDAPVGFADLAAAW